VVSLTRLLSLNLAPEIRVNAVAPGRMEGDWMERMLKDKYEDLMARRAKATPLRRCCTTEDVAEVIVSLLTGNRFVTGDRCWKALFHFRRSLRTSIGSAVTGLTSHFATSSRLCLIGFRGGT